MIKYLDTPIFGILISIITFEIGLFINRKTKIAILNPMLISVTLIISFLLYFDIDYEIYEKGGSIITFFLGPATVVLVVPLYRQIEKLKKSGIPILVGILVGAFTAIVSTYFLSKLFGLEENIVLSLVPRSVTAAISIEISKEIGGIPSLTVAATTLTGIVGSILGPYIYKIIGIEDETAQGVGLGCGAHALGTAKAMELGETQGGMGSLSISVAGLITVFLAPWLMKLFN